VSYSFHFFHNNLGYLAGPSFTFPNTFEMLSNNEMNDMIDTAAHWRGGGYVLPRSAVRPLIPSTAFL
jgi:hypothetical protein